MTIGKGNKAASDVPAPAQRAQSTLEIVWRPIETLKADAGNPRSHSRKQVRQLAESIETFGFNVPILVDRELRVVAGHGRLLALRQLGWTEVPTIGLDHLTEAQARAYTVADNRLAENTPWNDRLLALRLKDLSLMELDFAIAATGFEVGEIELRIAGLEPRHHGEPARERAKRTRNRGDARSTAPKARRVCREGEWWLLGPHRVHCGSALDPAACATLMAEESGEGSPASVCVCVSPAQAEAIIRRWQTLTGGNARHAESGACFDDVADDRIATPDASALR